MRSLKKRVDALECKHTGQLLFPNFLLDGVPEPYFSFHKSGEMSTYCSMDEAIRSILSGTIYELIKTKYKEYEITTKTN